MSESVNASSTPGPDLDLEKLKAIAKEISLMSLEAKMFDQPIDLYSQYIENNKIFMLGKASHPFPNSKGREVWLIDGKHAFAIYTEMRSLGVNVRLDPKEPVG